jgi:hypothetical protein
MDSYRDHPSEFEPSGSEESLAPDAEGTLAGGEERRLQVRAYNHWASLLNGCEFPSVEDLAPAELDEFAHHSVLFDFTSGVANADLRYVGQAIRDESGVDEDARTLADVPPRTLLSRIGGHCPQMVASRAPVGFESEFENLRGETLSCRGVLLPFSSDGSTIDFVYAVITWKAIEAAEIDEPVAAELSPGESKLADMIAQPGFSPGLTDVLKLADEIAAATATTTATAVSADNAVATTSNLAERLSAARSTADSVKASEGRTRAALYQALSLAYDFAIAADHAPDEYARLLKASGLKVQARAPMTAIAKLVFGADYDKTRLTEFAAALSYAKRVGLGVGQFQGFIEEQAGGLKALVAAERLERRPESRPDKRGEVARDKLRVASPISLAKVPKKQEFALVVTRRGADGIHEPVAVVADEALIARVIRTIA